MPKPQAEPKVRGKAATKREKAPEPKCLSMIIADTIRQEKNGKFFVVGAYADVSFSEPPEPAPLFIWATVLGVPPGEHSVEIRVADISAKREMRTGKQRFESSGANMVGHIVFELDDFSFPTNGSYRFRLFVDDERLGEQTVLVAFPQESTSSGVGTAED